MELVTYHVNHREFTIPREAVLATGVNLLTLQLIRDNTPEVRSDGATTTHVYLSQPAPELFAVVVEYIYRRYMSTDPENEFIDTSGMEEDERQWVQEWVYDFLDLTPSVFECMNRMSISS